MIRIKYPKIAIAALVTAAALIVSCKDTNPLDSSRYILGAEESISVPSIESGEMKEILPSSATISGTILSFGNCADIMEYGFVFEQYENPTIEKSQKISKGSAQKTLEYTVTVDGLKFDTKYYARAYAVNEKGVGYGEEVEFTTHKLVSTGEVKNVTGNSAEVELSMVDFSLKIGYGITKFGHVWGKTENPTVEASAKTEMKPSGNYYSDPSTYSSKLTGLTDNTKYYVRAYAINDMGVCYGEEVVFMTAKYTEPHVLTKEVGNVTTSSAKLYGEIVSMGNLSTISDYGFIWSTSSINNANSGSKVSLGSTSSPITFSKLLSNLSDGQNYYVRAYAINEVGIGLGNEVEFICVGINAPSVTTGEMKSIWTTSAEAQYTIKDTGNSEKLTETGVVWSTSPNPTLETGQYKVLTGYSYYEYTRGYMPRSFSLSISSLTEGTRYYLRADAKNEKGVGYGEVIEFTSKTN